MTYTGQKRPVTETPVFFDSNMLSVNDSRQFFEPVSDGRIKVLDTQPWLSVHGKVIIHGGTTSSRGATIWSRLSKPVQSRKLRISLSKI